MAIQNNLTTSSLRKFLPVKVLTGTAVTITGLESWLYNDGTSDPWWQGAAGLPYRWILTADITTSLHSSHLTRVPYQYTGVDIVPGMWVYADGDAKAVKVITVLSQTDSTIQCIVEDVDRFNTFNDPSSYGVGIFTNVDLVFFELGDDGLPKLTQLQNVVGIAAVSQVEARFRVLNPTVENRFFQLNHGFLEGQVLRIDKSTGDFVNATSDDIYIAGTVVAVGPGPHYFYLSPSTKIIHDLEPGLPGTVGDLIGINPITGDRVIVDGGNSTLYIKMTSEVKTFAIGIVDSPVTYPGNVIRVNNQPITLTGDDALPIETVIDQINASTISHGVVASVGSPANSVISTVSYASATPATKMIFSVNGVEIQVATPSIIFGTDGPIGWWDIIRGVNEQTASHGVYATFDPFSGFISFNHAEGLDITFDNILPLTSDGEDKTFTDMIGIQSITPALPALRLKLVRADGGSIVVSDVLGTATIDLGIQGSSNGSLPLALVVDKTMGANSMQQVLDLSALNAIQNPRSGDQVFVQNGVTQGEWELYVRTGATWTKISDYDAATTDAKTMTLDVDKTSSASLELGNVSSGTRIVNVTVVVSEPFNAQATISVGTADVEDEIITSANTDLSIIGSYEANTTYIYEGEEDGELFVHIDPAGSTSGKAKVIVSYL